MLATLQAVSTFLCWPQLEAFSMFFVFFTLSNHFLGSPATGSQITSQSKQPNKYEEGKAGRSQSELAWWNLRSVKRFSTRAVPRKARTSRSFPRHRMARVSVSSSMKYACTSTPRSNPHKGKTYVSCRRVPNKTKNVSRRRAYTAENTYTGKESLLSLVTGTRAGGCIRFTKLCWVGRHTTL